MKFAFISTMAGYPWGGSEILWQQTAQRLLANGQQLMAAMKRWAPQPAPLNALVSAGAEYHALRRPHRIERWIKPVPSIGWLKRFDPDLTVISQGYYSEGVPLMQALQAAGRRYVVIVQAAGEMNLPPYRDIAPLRAGLEGAERVYFVAAANRDLVRRLIMSALPQAELVRNPFQVPHGQPLTWPTETGTLKLACVARLEFYAKGHDLLLETLSRPKWRERDVSLTLYGNGPHRSYLESMRDHFQLGNVHFAGHTQDVSAIWQNHHLLVLPSRLEGTPLAMVEAMLCGRPAVVTDVGGNAEVVQEGLSGFVALAPNSHQIDAALERAWQARMQLAEMGLAAAQRAQALFPQDPARDFAQRLLTLAQSRV